jgi:hypothetical protein
MSAQLDIETMQVVVLAFHSYICNIADISIFREEQFYSKGTGSRFLQTGSTKLHGFTSHEAVIVTVTAMKACITIKTTKGNKKFWEELIAYFP